MNTKRDILLTRSSLGLSEKWGGYLFSSSVTEKNADRPVDLRAHAFLNASICLLFTRRI